MPRSSSSSQVPRVGALAMVGVTERSMRSMMPASSSRRNRSSSDAAAPADLHHVGDHAEVDDGIRLDHCPVQHPWIAWPHPADGVGVHVALQQPDAGIGRGLARADDDVLARSLLASHEVIDRDHVGTLRDAEPRRRLGRDVGREVARVHDSAALRDLEALTRVERDEGAVPHVVAAGDELDPARREHPVRQQIFVVGADRGLVGSLVESGLGPVLLDPPASEHRRCDAVEGG